MEDGSFKLVSPLKNRRPTGIGRRFLVLSAEFLFPRGYSSGRYASSSPCEPLCVLLFLGLAALGFGPRALVDCAGPLLAGSCRFSRLIILDIRLSFPLEISGLAELIVLLPAFLVGFGPADFLLLHRDLQGAAGPAPGEILRFFQGNVADLAAAELVQLGYFI